MFVFQKFVNTDFLLHHFNCFRMSLQINFLHRKAWNRSLKKSPQNDIYAWDMHPLTFQYIYTWARNRSLGHMDAWGHIQPNLSIYIYLGTKSIIGDISNLTNYFFSATQHQDERKAHKRNMDKGIITKVKVQLKFNTEYGCLWLLLSAGKQNSWKKVQRQYFFVSRPIAIYLRWNFVVQLFSQEINKSSSPCKY